MTSGVFGAGVVTLRAGPTPFPSIEKQAAPSSVAGSLHVLVLSHARRASLLPRASG